MQSAQHSSDFYRKAVPQAFTRALLAHACACGADQDALLKSAGFGFDPLRKLAQTSWVSPAQFSRLGLGLFRAMGDEAAGLMPDTTTPVGTTRMIALSMLGTGTLATAMHRAIEFNACCRVRNDARVTNKLVIDQVTREANLSYCCAAAPEVQQQVLCSLAVWLRFCGWLIGQHIDITQASCAGPEPASMNQLRHYFPCPIRWQQTANSVSFSARHLEAELVRDEGQLQQFLALAPYHLVIAPQASRRSISFRIRELLGDDFRDELPSFEELTSLLNMSARTLRRRLEREGTSYQRIKDNARRDAAIVLLSRHRLTVSEVAEQMGFSDPSAFHRSFKKWTGQSPGSYR